MLLFGYVLLILKIPKSRRFGAQDCTVYSAAFRVTGTRILCPFCGYYISQVYTVVKKDFVSSIRDRIAIVTLQFDEHPKLHATISLTEKKHCAQPRIESQITHL